MHILHTVLWTFPRVPSRRICLTIKSFFNRWSVPYSPDLNVWFRGDMVRRCQSLLWVNAMEISLGIISCFVGHLAHRTNLLQSATHCFLYTHLHVVSFSSQLQHRWSLKAPLHWFLLAENLVKILQSYQTNKPWEYEWKTNNKNNVHKMPSMWNA